MEEFAVYLPAGYSMDTDGAVVEDHDADGETYAAALED
jgi:hypothetical protein